MTWSSYHTPLLNSTTDDIVLCISVACVTGVAAVLVVIQQWLLVEDLVKLLEWHYDRIAITVVFITERFRIISLYCGRESNHYY